MKGTRVAIVVAVLAASIFLAVPRVIMADNSGDESVAELASAAPFNNDPYIVKQWAVPQSSVPPVAAANSQILIAVLDTGIDVNHKDLAGEVVDSVNFTGGRNTDDVNGHGTHVAGIIVAARNNGIGIAGTAPSVKLLNVKVGEDNGVVWPSNVAKGIIWATDRGAKIINISLTVPSRYQPLEEAINYAWSHGVVLVAAAGNHVKATTYPAAYSNVIAVAATTPDGKVWTESNDGEFVDAYAPGVSIVSTLPGTKYGEQSGSSMATAYVSAIAAQLINQTTDTDSDGKINDEIEGLLKTRFSKPN